MKVKSSQFKSVAQIEYYLNVFAVQRKMNTNFKVVARRKGWFITIFYSVYNRVRQLDYHFLTDGELTKSFLQNFLENVEIEMNQREVNKEFTAIKRKGRKKTYRLNYILTQKELKD